MKFLLLTSTYFFFTAYVAAIWIKFGVLPSISESYYRLKKLQKSFFTLAMFGTGLPITIYAEGGLMFFAGAGICFVGAAPAFREDMTGRVHVIGAVGGIVLGLLSLWLDYSLWIPQVVFAGLTFFLTFFRVRNHTWWIEILAYMCIVGCLWLN